MVPVTSPALPGSHPSEDSSNHLLLQTAKGQVMTAPILSVDLEQAHKSFEAQQVKSEYPSSTADVGHQHGISQDGNKFKDTHDPVRTSLGLPLFFSDNSTPRTNYHYMMV